ncbi:MAG TPA: tetratricopeptide repeat protein, partial [Nannocystaceae bacterium]|nr:tetratricopeptide repeat protein [Nannocystaceae bacterium]
VLGAAGAFGAVAIVAFASTRPEIVEHDPWCGADDPVRRAWNPDTRAQLDQVFASASLSVRDSWDRHAPRLESAARAITNIRTQVCSKPDEQQRACLRRRVAALEATVAALRSADDAALVDVAMLVASVPTGPCSDDVVGESIDARTDEVVAAIERARLFGLAAQMEGAREAVNEALALATELDDRALLSEALLVYGEYLVAVGESDRGAATLRDAAWLAEAARNDGIAADAWGDLAFHEAYVRHDIEAARANARLAEATCERIGCSGARLSRLWNTLGVIDRAAGNLDAAIDRYQHSLAAATEVSPDASRDVITALGNLAVAYTSAGREAEALPLFERALAAQADLLRPDHPEIAIMLGNTAGTLRALGRDADALELDRRSLGILERAYGRENGDVAKARINLAMSLRRAGALDEALAQVQQALPVFERLLGTEHPEVAYAHTFLAMVLDDRHDEAGAIPQYERGVEIAVAVGDAVQEYTARARFGLMLFRRRELERAHEQLSRAMQAHERGHLRLYPLTVRVLDALANIEIGVGQLDDARARIALADTVPLDVEIDAEVMREHAAVRERLAATRPP